MYSCGNFEKFIAHNLNSRISAGILLENNVFLFVKGGKMKRGNIRKRLYFNYLPQFNWLSLEAGSWRLEGAINNITRVNVMTVPLTRGRARGAWNVALPSVSSSPDLVLKATRNSCRIDIIYMSFMPSTILAIKFFLSFFLTPYVEGVGRICVERVDDDTRSLPSTSLCRWWQSVDRFSSAC